MGVLKPGLAVTMAGRLERALYDEAAGVTGQSQDIVNTVRARCRDTPSEVITNGVDPARFGARFADDDARQTLGYEPGPLFIFAGLLGLAQGLDQILDASATLSDANA